MTSVVHILASGTSSKPETELQNVTYKVMGVCSFYTLNTTSNWTLNIITEDVDHGFWAQPNKVFYATAQELIDQLKARKRLQFIVTWATIKPWNYHHYEFSHQIWDQPHQWFVCKCTETSTVRGTDEQWAGQRNRLTDTAIPKMLQST